MNIEMENWRCSSVLKIRKTTASLAFGLLTALVSATLLVVALCFQTWASRQEMLLVQHDAFIKPMTASKPGEKVVINIPIEVPTLGTKTVYMPETFYNGKLDELYNKRLREISEQDPNSLGIRVTDRHRESSVPRRKRNFIEKTFSHFVNLSQQSSVSNFLNDLENSSLVQEYKNIKFTSTESQEPGLNKYINITEFIKPLTWKSLNTTLIQRNHKIHRTRIDSTLNILSFDLDSSGVLQDTNSASAQISSKDSLPYAGTPSRRERPRLIKRSAQSTEASLVHFSICLWRICLYSSNTTLDCYSIFYVDDSQQSSHKHLDNISTITYGLLQTLRWSCCGVGIGWLVLVSSVCLSVKALLTSYSTLQKPPELKSGHHQTLCQQQILATAAALMAVAGITIGGGLFQFCSGVTDRLIVSSSHSLHYQRITNQQPTAILRWPVLMAANSVVGCFLAAFSTGYTLFLSWDKQILAFFTNTESSDQLVATTSYDALNTCSRKVLCNRCSENARVAASDIGKQSNGIYEASEPKVNFEDTPQNTLCVSNISSTDSEIGCSSNNLKRKCVQCMWDGDERCYVSLHNNDGAGNHNAFMIHRPLHTLNNYSKCNHSSLPSADQGSNQPYIQNIQQSMKNEFSNFNYIDQFNIGSIDQSREFSLQNSLEICDDPKCQEQQLKHDASLHSNDINVYPIGSVEPSAKENVNYMYRNNSPVIFDNIREINDSNRRLTSSCYTHQVRKDDHLYSNLIGPEFSEPTAIFSDSLRRSSNQRWHYSIEEQCECCRHQSMKARCQQRISSNHFYPHKTVQYSVSPTEVVNGVCESTLDQTERLNRCSTLPAKFSRRGSYFPPRQIEYSRRDCQSTMDMNSIFYKSNEHLNSHNSELSKISWRNSSVPTLRRNVDEFGSRKSVKSVKFVTPDDDDDDDDDDSEDQFEDTLRISHQISRREYHPPDGSSDSPQLE